MRQTAGTHKSPGDNIVKDTKVATRKHHSSKDEDPYRAGWFA
jgi:hypothetical protein